jgi:hypothetical protein
MALLLAQGNQSFWFVPSVMCGAMGTLGPAYIGALVSLEFWDEDSRSCS